MKETSNQQHQRRHTLRAAVRRLHAKAAFLAVCCMAALCAHAQAPAFPGAEGHGRYTTGGRGGKVIHVTNLNDSGTGSLRAAVQGSSKKVVVFDVGGVIALKSELVIGDNTTIAGQTAPEPGITLRYYTVRPGANNVIRFIRIRRGQEIDVNDGADALWQRQKTAMLLDHCSFSWSIDEVASFYDNNNFTMQWCTVGESLNNAGHGKSAHGYGGIWGGKLASFHHNMILHVNNRAPRFNGARYIWSGYTSNQLYGTYKWDNCVQAENVDFRNCVIYNWGNGNGCYGGPGGGQVNIVNNYYKAGPSTTNTTRVTEISAATDDNSDLSKYPQREIIRGMSSRYYINGNYVTAASSPENYDWKGVKYDSSLPTIDGERYTPDANNLYGSAVEHKTSGGTACVRIKMDQPAPAGEVTTHKAATAFLKVTSYAGASLCRDNVDERYATEARNGTATYKGSVTKKPGLIDLVADVNGYNENNFGTGSRPVGFDTDQDGIPDDWEKANGLDADNADDALLYTLDTRGCYSNLEVYLNSLVEDIMKAGNADALEAVDEYYPQWTDTQGNVHNPADGDVPQADTYELSQLTYTATTGNYTWNFSNGFSISSSKSYAAGQENGIKYSRNTSYTINIPDGTAISAFTFTGYDNYADAEAYLSELGGTTFDKDLYSLPAKDAAGNYTVVSHTVQLEQPVTGTLSFTFGGQQVVAAITLTRDSSGDEPGNEPGEEPGEEPGTVVKQEQTTGTVRWIYDSGEADEAPVFSESAMQPYLTPAVKAGSNLTVAGTVTSNTEQITLTKVTFASQEDKANDATNALRFTLTPAADCTFMPTAVSLKAMRGGTDSGNMDIAWEQDGKTSRLATAVRPNRRNQGTENYSQYDYPLSQEATSSPVSLKVNFYGIASNKDYSVGDVVVSGLLTRTYEEEVQSVATAIATVGADADVAPYYTLQGQPLLRPTHPGVYIHRGRKVVVR